MRGLAHRLLVSLLLALLALWATGILLGALKATVTKMGPSPFPCDRCLNR